MYLITPYDSEYIKQLNCILQDVIHILSKCFNNAHLLHGNLFLGKLI